MTLPLETARLLIREYSPADLDEVARMFADPALTLGGRPRAARSRQTSGVISSTVGKYVLYRAASRVSSDMPVTAAWAPM